MQEPAALTRGEVKIIDPNDSYKTKTGLCYYVRLLATPQIQAEGKRASDFLGVVAFKTDKGRGKFVNSFYFKILGIV